MDVKKTTIINHVVTAAIVLALLVVTLGAYTRLTDAGLGCPDWPGCYGHMVLPTETNALSAMQHHYPHLPLETPKAWTEMIHRYVAGTLVLLILMSVVFLLWSSVRPSIKRIAFLLIFLVFFQAALGMWTVTLKLLPVVVMGHLLGGLLIFASLCYLRWQLSAMEGKSVPYSLHRWVGLGVVIVLLQIILGGWVSANYAGIACIGFPQCNGFWLPPLQWAKAFNLFAPIGANYQGGLLAHDARMTIQFVHRLGALVTLTYVLSLSVAIIFMVKETVVRRVSLAVSLLVILQTGLGILNVVYLLPLPVAIAHNGGAALLLAAMVSLFYVTKEEKG